MPIPILAWAVGAAVAAAGIKTMCDLKSKLEKLDDDELMNIVQHSSDQQRRAVAIQILKHRGYPF